MDTEQERCLECDGKAQYIRHTQFAGNHPFCSDHAWKQQFYEIDDQSDVYWSSIDEVTQEHLEVVKVSAENDVGSSLRVGDARDL